jgi:hypothetical protein
MAESENSIMKTRTWWIDEPVLSASGNPTDGQLDELRKQGFSVAFSLLEENKLRPKYNARSAALAGWHIHSIPIKELDFQGPKCN